ncbi:MAG: GH92 family glycosyl hydrolase [Planctomycetaceae bacterium]|nr:GH92 family glycosyl hydrolase [Planctomycetaceae bacterium]
MSFRLLNRTRFAALYGMAALVLISAATAGERGAGGLLQYVNILQGTDSTPEFSYGNTLPLVGTPWGMTDWTPQTCSDENPWFYRYPVRKILGFRATHQPSPWMGDYGNFLIMPQTGPLVPDIERGADYDLKASVYRPDYLRIALPRYGVTTELTASERCGVFRFTFDKAKTGRLLVDPAGPSAVEFVGRRFQGFSKAHANPAAENYATYFVGELDRDVSRHGTFAGSAKRKMQRGESEPRIGGYLEFDTTDRPTVEVRIATSHISFEQALRNLQTETEGGFEAVRARTIANWEKNLKRIEIDGTDDQRRTFYTCLYRALKFPHRFHELNAEGKPIHFSPWDGRVHDGVCYVDSGLWDTFRTQFPLYSIVYPTRLGEIVQGWLNAYQEGGWLPQWPSPGGFGGMVGTHADAMIADAMMKRIPGFDVQRAYAALRQDAFGVRSGQRDGGRGGMKEYLKLGYVPPRAAPDWLSASLDFAYDDWCVAQAAKLLGKTDDYRVLMERSQNYRKCWDSQVGFMRAKKADGSWAEPKFDEFAWGNGYCEGGPWQCSWAVQHDAAGLAELLGGKALLAAKLDKMFGSPSTFHAGGYGCVIHEMQEMAALKSGQYAQSNQPSFHHPYLYAAVGQPWKTEFWTRKACAEFYNSGPRGYIGDEDNGSAASWYMLSAMGFYPLTPGHASYVLTSPALAKAVLHLPTGRDFTIAAAGNGPKSIYVQKRTLSGREITGTWIAHQDIAAGGMLEVELGEKPNVRAVKDAELPYSASNELRR